VGSGSNGGGRTILQRRLIDAALRRMARLARLDFEPPMTDQDDGPPAHGPPPYDAGPYAGPPRSPQPAPIHPITAGRALSIGWSLFRFRWPALVAVVALFSVPAYVVNAAWYVAYGPVVVRWYSEALDAVARGTVAPPLDVGIWLGFLGSSLLVGLATMLGGAAATSILGWTYGGGRRRAPTAARDALRRAGSLVGVAAVTLVVMLAIAALTTLVAVLPLIGLGGGAGTFLALCVAVSGVVAAVFVVLRWALAMFVIMLEGRPALGALGRSWRLVAGSTWRVLGYVVMIALIGSLVGLIGSIAELVLFGAGVDLVTGQPEPPSTARTLFGLASSAALTVALWPWLTAVMLLLYYDLRFGAGERLGPPPD
jgi:hypothetical protein